MYSFPNLEPVHCSMSCSNCCFLICIQFSQEASKVFWYSHLLNFAQFVVMHTVKGWSTVNEAEIDDFLESPCFFCCQTNVDKLISRSSIFYKPSLYIWKFLFHVPLKSIFKDFEHYLDNMWNECNCMVAWTLFHIALLWDWNEKWPFPVF